MTSPTASAMLLAMAEVWTFRDAAPADVPAVVALVESAYRGEVSRQGWTTEADLLDGQRTDVEAVSGLLVRPGSAVVLAEAAGELRGCAHLLVRRGTGVAEFGMFAVVPRLQRAGLGKALLAECERRARAAGAATMEMTVIAQRDALIAWYGRRGYRVTGERRPFPHGDPRFGLPRRPDLVFDVLVKELS